MVGQVPTLVDVKADPVLARSRQAPLAALRTAMSALPSLLKSPTVANCVLVSDAHTDVVRLLPLLSETDQLPSRVF